MFLSFAFEVKALRLLIAISVFMAIKRIRGHGSHGMALNTSIQDLDTLPTQLDASVSLMSFLSSLTAYAPQTEFAVVICREMKKIVTRAIAILILSTTTATTARDELPVPTAEGAKYSAETALTEAQRVFSRYDICHNMGTVPIPAVTIFEPPTGRHTALRVPAPAVPAAPVPAAPAARPTTAMAATATVARPATAMGATATPVRPAVGTGAAIGVVRAGAGTGPPNPVPPPARVRHGCARRLWQTVRDKLVAAWNWLSRTIRRK
eukprot:GHVQ01018722.1.p1 GENE.GHVQ01018722.1~~GHVQ01018722.1.p1  ORF type:complete len:265 (+),score=26.93 GHVQ01018722.1:73-867(+)